MGNIIHVIPLNDLAGHYTDEIPGTALNTRCGCNPDTEEVKPGAWLIIHNSYDRREEEESADY